MVIKAGYKMTEVGVIPEDWEVKQLGNIGHFLKGRGVKKDEAHSGSLPCIRYGEIYTHHDDYIKSFNSWISPQVAATATRLKQGDLLFAGSGETKVEIGKCVAFLQDNQAYAGGDIVVLRANGINPKFMGFYCNTAPIATQKASKGQGDAVVHISAAALSSIALSLPPLPEQNAIAAALSDVDDLIFGLEKLIEKKRNIKQATMQQLLTGKTRLPGFSDDWKMKTFGELFSFSGGYSASREQLTEEGVCYLHYGDIHGASKTSINTKYDFLDIPKLSIKLNQISETSLLKHGDVVFVDASEDDMGTSRHLVIENEDDIPFISGLHTIVAKSKTNELANRYKHYCFKTLEVRQQFMFYAVGTKVSGVSKSNIVKLIMPIPSVPEQIAIAELLTSIDVELVNLEDRLVKTRNLKQGMMQELLTGRTRLI